MTKELLLQADELKPCPFCGLDVHVGYHSGYLGKKIASIQCFNSDCVVFGSMRVQADTEAETIGSWNTRTPDIKAQPPKEV